MVEEESPQESSLGAGSKIGRSLTEISTAQWQVIEQMARDMCTHEDMADYLGISKRTFYASHLRDRFERVTRMASAKRRWEVRKRQAEAAMKGPLVGSIWWGKQHLGQTDRAQVTTQSTALDSMAGATERLADLLERLAKRKTEAPHSLPGDVDNAPKAEDQMEGHTSSGGNETDGGPVSPQ